MRAYRGRAPRAAVLLAVLLPALAGSSSAQLRDLIGERFDAHVVGVIDGDTVDAVPAGEKRAIRIRLDGVDAPERGEPFNDAARRLTRTLLFDRRARFEGRAVDRYGRLVARAFAGDKDTSLELLRAGLACHYELYSTDPILASAQRQARQEGRGFWAASAARPRCTRAPAQTRPGSTAVPAPAPTSLHGNTSSRVYHGPRCPNYNCRTCTRVFPSEAEARAAGYRPAGDCGGR